MGGRVAKRVLLAPIVVVIATTAVPPATATFSPLNEWLTKVVPASIEIVSSLNAWPAATVPPAPIAVSFQSNALIDASLPAGEIAAAGADSSAAKPAAASLGVTDALARAGDATLHLLNEWRVNAVPVIVAILSSANDWLAANVPPPPVTVAFYSDGLTDGPRPAEQTAIATAELPDERPVLASLGVPAAPIQAKEAKILPPVAEVKTLSIHVPVEKPVYASLGLPAAVSDARMAVADPLPAQDTKISRDVKIADDVKIASGAKPQEAAAEEKQVYASLGVPVAAIDTRAAPAPLPREVTAISSRPQAEEFSSKPKPEEVLRKPRPEEMQVQVKHVYASLGSSAAVGDIARRDRIEPQALPSRPAADGAPAEKRASLGPALQSDAYTPPENMRIAYDAPLAAEQPKSIGKRKYVDDTVYTGLGKPEALLEALKHMGANAQKLGLPASLWCADFMNMVLRKTGIEATGSRAARSYLKYGKKIDEPRVGAIAIFTRGSNGGHIGIVRGTDGAGNPIIVSGNHNNKVAEAIYPKSRVLAYVVPHDTSH